MKRLTFSFILSSTLLFSACQNNSDDQFESVYNEVELSLNKGEKWKVPGVMAIYMDSSIQLVSSRKQIDDQLITDLVRHKNGFVSNCSMEGKGHDVLHAWLIPYIGVLEAAETTQLADEKGHLFKDIENAHKLYQDFFE